MKGNKATGGRGGFISVNDESASSIFVLSAPDITNNEALTSGGAFYMGGTGDKSLTITEAVQISQSRANTGSGAVAYMAGSSSYVSISYAVQPVTATISDNQALVQNGGLFHS